jgi:t-SNARE complex subunit (syntaxin)
VELLPSDKTDDEISKDLKEFILRVSLAQGYIKRINLFNNQLVNLKSELTTAIGEKQKSIHDTIQKKIDEIANLQQKTKLIIQKHSDEILKDLNIIPNIVEQEKRIVRNLHGSLIKNFQETTENFQMIESEIRQMNQAMVIRTAEIAFSRKLNRDEQAEILNDPGVIQSYIDARLTGTAHSGLKNAVSDIEERHNDLIKLERNLEQVGKLMTELAALVHLQGEMIDNIYDNVSQAKKDVLTGEKFIGKSVENMKAARKKKCIILIIVLVVLVVIIAPILGVKLGSA